MTYLYGATQSLRYQRKAFEYYLAKFSFSLRSIITASILAIYSLAANATQPLVEYEEFGGPKPHTTYSLYAWEGEHVAILTQSDDLDESVMAQILEAVDSAFVFYRDVSGGLPRDGKTYNGKLIIAEVDITCGAGCGGLGNNGVEIKPKYFSNLYEGVASNGLFDQVVFYELGRNFFLDAINARFYQSTDQQNIRTYMSTAYAIHMRHRSMEYAGVDSLTKDDQPFLAEMDRLLTEYYELYMADPNNTIQSTVFSNTGPRNSRNWGAADVMAAFLLQLEKRNGGVIFTHLLIQAALTLPEAETVYDSTDNFILAASIAARRDLRDQFREWRWPELSRASSQLLIDRDLIKPSIRFSTSRYRNGTTDEITQGDSLCAFVDGIGEEANKVRLFLEDFQFHQSQTMPLDFFGTRDDGSCVQLDTSNTNPGTYRFRAEITFNDGATEILTNDLQLIGR